MDRKIFLKLHFSWLAAFKKNTIKDISYLHVLLFVTGYDQDAVQTADITAQKTMSVDIINNVKTHSYNGVLLLIRFFNL